MTGIEANGALGKGKHKKAKSRATSTGESASDIPERKVQPECRIYSEEHSEKNTEPRRLSWPSADSWIAIFTFCGILLAGGQVWLSRLAFQQGERSWVLCDGISIDKNPKSGHGVDWIVYMKNFGKSPAFDVRTQAALGYGVPTWEDPSILPPLAGSVLAPGQFVTNRVNMDARFDKDSPPYILGLTTYKDEFRKIRHTRFCVQMSVEPQDVKANPVFCERFNEAD